MYLKYPTTSSGVLLNLTCSIMRSYQYGLVLRALPAVVFYRIQNPERNFPIVRLEVVLLGLVSVVSLPYIHISITSNNCQWYIVNSIIHAVI